MINKVSNFTGMMIGTALGMVVTVYVASELISQSLRFVFP